MWTPSIEQQRIKEEIFDLLAQSMEEIPTEELGNVVVWWKQQLIRHVDDVRKDLS